MDKLFTQHKIFFESTMCGVTACMRQPWFSPIAFCLVGKKTLIRHIIYCNCDGYY